MNQPTKGDQYKKNRQGQYDQEYQPRPMSVSNLEADVDGQGHRRTGNFQ